MTPQQKIVDIRGWIDRNYDESIEHWLELWCGCERATVNVKGDVCVKGFGGAPHCLSDAETNAFAHWAADRLFR
jgi:hypothetical protein